jgi:hypothetical protein
MRQFLTLHYLAQEHGDGLRPELAELFERRAIAEAQCAPEDPPFPLEDDRRAAAKVNAASVPH